jgi:hypothetical protein
MTQCRSRRLAVAAAEGVVVHAALTVAGLGALAAWARYCETHKHHR